QRLEDGALPGLDAAHCSAPGLSLYPSRVAQIKIPGEGEEPRTAPSARGLDHVDGLRVVEVEALRERLRLGARREARERRATELARRILGLEDGPAARGLLRLLVAAVLSLARRRLAHGSPR